MRRIRLARIAFALAVGRSVCVHAQTQLTVDVGGAALRQEGVSGGAATFALDLRLPRARQSLDASALGVTGTDGSGSAQAMATGSLYAPATRFFRWEVGASASAFTQTGDVPVFGAQVFARAYAGRASHGLFIGAGGGPSVAGGVSWPTSAAQAGGWARIDREQFIATLTATRTTVGLVTAFSNGKFLQRNVRVNIGDAGVEWRGDHGAFEYSLAGGARRWLALRDGWASASATAWIAPRYAVVGSIGRALEDVARGVPASRYATIALRMSLKPHGVVVPPSVVRIAGTTIVAARAADGTCVIDVRAAGARGVELMADFTDWEPVSLERAGDVWRLSRAIEAGPHRVVIRVDGGEWRVPANLPRVSDELGLEVGLITVP
ncbi:MAG TPA: glycogen-binding domain-containing protein [Gemmatimonadaceae bacterium]